MEGVTPADRLEAPWTLSSADRNVFVKGIHALEPIYFNTLAQGEQLREAGPRTSHDRHQPTVQTMLALCKTGGGSNQGSLAWASELPEPHVEG